MATVYLTIAADNLVGFSSGVTDFIYVNDIAFLSLNDTVNAGAGGEAMPDLMIISGAAAAGQYSLSSTDYPNITGVDRLSISSTTASIYVYDSWATVNNNYDNSGGVSISPTSTSQLYTLYVNAQGLSTYGLNSYGAALGDTLLGGAFADTISGRSGSDSLSGGAGVDRLQGNSGADSLSGGAGADLLQGDDGADLFIDSAAHIVSGDLFNGGAGVDTLSLNGAGVYSLNTATLNSVEMISGGAGVDAQSVNITKQQLADYGGPITNIDLGGGTDRLTIVSVTGVLSLTSVALTGVEVVQVSAVSGAAWVYGHAANPNVIAMQGSYNYQISNGAGADLSFGNLGADSIYGLAGPDTLVGMSGSDQLFGDSGADLLFGGTGADTFYGGSGADILVGGLGADSIGGDAGADTLFGGEDGDRITTAAADTLGDLILADPNGHAGADTIHAGGGADTVFGGDGGDEIRGGLGADQLLGGSGSDTLQGGDSGGTGDAAADVLWGETGADRFQFYSGFGVDLVADFEPGVDKIQLLGFNAFSTFAALQATATVNSHLNGMSLVFADGSTLQIVGMTSLSAGDFII